MLIRSFTLKSEKEKEKRLSHDVIYTFVTHASLVPDVTDCQIQNGSARYGRVSNKVDF